MRKKINFTFGRGGIAVGIELDSINSASRSPLFLLGSEAEMSWLEEQNLRRLITPNSLGPFSYHQ